MPQGVSSDLQTTTSNLVDAYKRNELHSQSGLGIFALSAIIVDKAEPSEALKANIAWSLGLENPIYLLSSLQLAAFRKKQKSHSETDVKGEKGAYFVSTDLILEKNTEKSWKIIANVKSWDRWMYGWLITCAWGPTAFAEKENYPNSFNYFSSCSLYFFSECFSFTSKRRKPK